MVYPALTYVEEMGYAAVSSEGQKKQYQITDAGSAHLKENQTEVDALLLGLSQYGERIAAFQEQMAEDEATEEKWGHSPKHQQKKEWRELKAEFHEIKHELKAAIFEKLGASLEEKRRVLDVLRAAVAEIRK